MLEHCVLYRLAVLMSHATLNEIFCCVAILRISATLRRPSRRHLERTTINRISSMATNSLVRLSKNMTGHIASRAMFARPSFCPLRKLSSGPAPWPPAGVVHGFVGAVGYTPLVRLHRLSEETGRNILGKAEFMKYGGAFSSGCCCSFASFRLCRVAMRISPGGSVKDRAALAIIQDAEARGQLKAGGTVVEGTAGMEWIVTDVLVMKITRALPWTVQSRRQYGYRTSPYLSGSWISLHHLHAKYSKQGEDRHLEESGL